MPESSSKDDRLESTGMKQFIGYPQRITITGINRQASNSDQCLKDNKMKESLALKALKLYEAYMKTPVDRGGKDGPKGKAFQAFLEAKAAALAEAAKEEESN